MNSLQIFNSSEFGEIRGIEIDNEPWLVGKDVAEVLGYKRTADAIREHVDECDKGVGEMETPGGRQKMTIINESGFYSLVFNSKMPRAKEFKHWVTSEVLPAIRKHGAYATPTTIENIIANPSNAIKLLQALAEEQNKNNELKVENSQLRVDKQIMQPKADYFDELVDRNLLVSFTEASKQLGVKRKDVINFCLDHGYLYRDKKNKLLPRANKKARDLFQVVQCYNEKTKWAGSQTLLTPKGIETLRLLMLDA